MESIKFLKRVYRIFFKMSKEQEIKEYKKIILDEITDQKWKIKYHSKSLINAKKKLEIYKKELILLR